jgi:hypothetical protein
MTGAPEQRQDRTNHDHNDAERPDDSDLSDESNNEENYAENDQGRLLADSCLGRGQEDIWTFLGQTAVLASLPAGRVC